MLIGFESITKELSEYERETLLPKIVSGLSTKKGKDLAITNERMCEAMQARGFKITGPRLRKIIEMIREQQIIPGLLASSKGYWVSDSAEEIREYLKSVRGRKSALIMIENRMMEYLIQLEKAG